MVAGPLLDLEGPVELLQQHDPSQVVGKGHGGHGQAQVGPGLERGVHAVGGADEEHQGVAPAVRPLLQPGGELLAGERS